ncbi:hypothetical protein [Mycolicibacterium fortuitum]
MTMTTTAAPDLAAMSRNYRLAHTRGAYRVRCDAYDLAMLYLSAGHPELVTPKRIHAMLNGGQCMFSAVRRGIADARRDYDTVQPSV